MNCGKSHGESTTNKVVFHPIKSVMDDTIANPATFPEWGECFLFVVYVVLLRVFL
jgi:hypothetical protein